MEFKFVSGDARDLKRKRPYGACESCKKRKKRCFHGQDAEEGDTSTQDLQQIPLFQPPAPPNAASGQGLSGKHIAAPVDTTSALSDRPVLPSKPSRFLGDTHAEANLEAEGDISSERRDQDGVGVWFDTNDDEADSVTSRDNDADIAKGLCIADEDKKALISIFIARVQPLLPILEADHINIDKAMGMAETLSLAVCLVACKDQRAKQYRKFSGNNALLSVSAFASKLHKTISRRIRNWRSFDRMVLIRILTLMSTHQEGPDGAEEASMQLSQAVHHAYSIGMHLTRVSVDEKTQEDTARLFWCIWSWDKVSSAWNGRPRMTYEMDVGLSFVDSLPLFDTPARLWMKLARLLSSVTDLYNPRPCVDTESHIKEFPRWEFLLEEEEVDGMDEGFLTTLELFYHSVSMLSCRIKLLVGRKRAFASSLRRSLSAATVYSISKCVPPEDLAPLPVVPYAYCLATLVAYQQYRCNHHRVHRKIAEEKLMHFQEQLQAMSSYWHAAKSMSRKTQRVLREFRRRNGAENRPARAGAESEGTLGSSKLSTISTPSITSPSLGGARNFSAPVTSTYNSASGSKYPNQMGFASQGGYQDTAFADMDVTFGNLMDMNAFTGDIEFALTPYMDGGYDAGAAATTAAHDTMWVGGGMNGGV
ncbi:hypothetical protein K461DRAFT_288960 [Myriangium duriaei CBS 260.36]|uniref:Xylanolytic transcriptional activator regulatory domain-containing protein n=1 Tax=Myriangium duriaei CBS 260.36 TaxID=1168546 RepID=A0A9P4J7M2_9PEZI|nr:hypothetical protein K461DRAFT_288960 [Myriangium duriaei CBS 260.36]